MREILFRGKHTSSGKWVTSLSIRQEADGSIYLLVKNTWYRVAPETVGQYTGLTDTNGNEIFEGDIVQRRRRELFVNNIFNFKVVFIPVRACFTAVDISGGNITFISDYINNKYSIEIIGNIHDNPELLKEADNE